MEDGGRKFLKVRVNRDFCLQLPKCPKEPKETELRGITLF